MDPAASPEPARQWLTRNVKVLSAVSLAQDAASELMYPLLPILLTSVLGAPAAVVGIVEGLAEGAAAALKYVSGRISDRVGRKPAILTGYGLAAIGKIIVAAAGIWTTVLLGRVVDRVGKGIRGAPRDALLAEGIPTNALGRAFGFHRAADTIGAVIGPLLGLAVLRATGGDVQTALWIAVIPAVLSVGLILLVREPRTREDVVTPDGRGEAAQDAAPGGPSPATTEALNRQGGPSPLTDPEVPAGPRTLSTARGLAGPLGHGEESGPPSGPDTSHAHLPDRVRALAGVLGLFALVNFPDVLILLRLTEVGFTPAALMGAYALFNLANAAIAYPAGALSDRWPRSRVYALGLACFSVGYLGLGLAEEPWVVVVLLITYGGFAGITEGVGRAWISALAPVQMRGRAQGVFQALSGLGILVAGLWAGLAWDAGPGAGVVPLVISGLVGAVASIALLLVGGLLDTRP